MESLRQSESIKTITVRHEQAGGFMAATYGRLTGLLLPVSLFSGYCACLDHGCCQHFEHAEGFTAAARMALSYVMPLDGHEVDTHTLSRDYLMLCSAALLVPCVSCIQLGVLLAIST